MLFLKSSCYTLALLSLSLGLTACNKENTAANTSNSASSAPQLTQSSASASKKEPLLLKQQDLYQSQPTSMPTYLSINGTFKASSQALVKAKTAGELKNFTVKEGDFVKQGQMLGYLSNTDYSDRVLSNIAQQKSIQAQVDLARQQLIRQQALAKDGFISPNALDTYQYNLATAQANLEGAKANRKIAEKGIQDAAIYAPISGIVMTKHAQNQEKLSPDNKIVELINLNPIEFEAKVAGDKISNIYIGMPAQITFGEQIIDANVKRIAPMADSASRMIDVFLQANNANQSIKAGVFANGKLVGKSIDGWAVPIDAVQRGQSQAFVYIVKNNKIEKQMVNVIAEDKQALISEAINEPIVIIPLTSKNIGQSVKIN